MAEMIDSDREDYRDMIASVGMTEDDVQALTHTQHDRLDLPLNQYGLTLRDSPIHGIGLFSLNTVEPDAVIMPANLGGARTQAGRYTNHSMRPNCKMEWAGGNIQLTAIAPISSNDELLVDYRQSREVSQGQVNG